MRITTLVDNRPSPDDPTLQAESGLSQCIEIGGHRLLLDMGAWTGHCTGDEAFQVLRTAMGQRVQQLYTGSRLEFRSQP